MQKENTSNKWHSVKKLILYLSIGLYLIACILPCLETEAEILRGITCLGVGWFSILSDWSLLAIWSSNIFFFIALIFQVTKLPNTSPLIFNSIALVLGILMYFKASITYDTEMPVIHFHWGYYAWVGSYLCAFVAGLLGITVAKEQKVSLF